MHSLDVSSQIENINIPSPVSAGVPFSVSYDARSIETEKTKFFYGYLFDTITQSLIEGSYWETVIGPGDVYNFQKDDMIIDEPLTGQIVIGHYLPEICDWIDSKGGPLGVTIGDVFDIIDSYVFEVPPAGGWSFVPTIMHVFGVIDYFLGFDGGTSTGCEFEV